MTIRSFCIHGHFYQPPREDPITGYIPSEEGATPYKNWNERIFNECYRPNAELGNFGHISFNLGPTLCTWMETHDPNVYRLIQAQDHANVIHYGVGNAIAQAYNHTILPLATYGDKVTQIYWGIADFTHRFNRKPQGMWLPETGVDIDTLKVLADQGIEYTILAPWQADCEELDPTQPYRVGLPGGQCITVFFYHQDLSTKVSFDPGATRNADLFIQNEILPCFKPDQTHYSEPQLLLIASDGELYGHHQSFRDRFLAHLVNGASKNADVTITYPALWLESYQPNRFMRLRENTSWSCHHGMMRWMGECACAPGNGRWKYYLRRAFDRLAQSLDSLYIETVYPFITDPWALRNQYIHVMLGELSAEELINDLAGRRLDTEQVRQIHLLLESQRERQRIFTSCGWYFSDFGRIEPKNNVAYAAQAVRLARLATGVDLSPQVTADLQSVVSSDSGLRGDKVYNKQVRRAEALKTY